MIFATEIRDGSHDRPIYARRHNQAWIVPFRQDDGDRHSQLYPLTDNYYENKALLYRWIEENGCGDHHMFSDALGFEHEADAMMCYLAWRR
jgi:hypothetical protein